MTSSDAPDHDVPILFSCTSVATGDLPSFGWMKPRSRRHYREETGVFAEGRQILVSVE